MKVGVRELTDHEISCVSGGNTLVKETLKAIYSGAAYEAARAAVSGMANLMTNSTATGYSSGFYGTYGSYGVRMQYGSGW